MGKALAQLLKAEIGKADGGTGEVNARLALAAGIEDKAMSAILDSSTIAPPLAQLRSFAVELKIPLGDVLTAAEKDGCKFELSMASDPAALAQHLPTSGESKSTFIARCQSAGNSHEQCLALFDRSRLQLQQGQTPEGSDFKATPFADLPVTDEPWNPRNQTLSAIIGEVRGDDNFARMKQAHLAFAPGEGRGDPPETSQAYKLPIARIVNGRLTVIKDQLSIAIGAINGARTALDIPDAAKRSAYNVAVRYLRKAGVETDDIPELRLSAMFGMMLSRSDPFKLRKGTEYLKDIISTGTYTHPNTGQVIDVTIERMDQWVETFNSMRANGVDIEVVDDHSDKAADILGYAPEMERIGDTLYAVLDMRGERGKERAEVCRNVSIMIQPDYVDGKDNHYGEAITHIAACQQPVVPGQSEFIPMSRLTGGRSDVPILLQTETTEDDMKDETVKKFATILGVDTLTEEQAPTRIEAKINELTAKVKDLEGFKASYGKDKPKKLEPEVVNMLAKAEEKNFDDLAKNGNLLPDVATALKAEFVGPAGNRNAYALSSVQSGNGTEESQSSRIITILSKNDPVELGERTGPQSLLLTHSVPGKDTSFSQETQDEMVKMTGGTPEKKTEEPANA